MVPSLSDSDFSITTVMQASSNANSTGTSSAMPSSNAAGTPNDRISDPLLSENSNFDNSTEIPQAVTAPGLQVPGGNNVVPSVSVSNSIGSSPVMLASSDANSTGTSTMPSSNAAGTPNDWDWDPLLSENSNFDHSTEISQAIYSSRFTGPWGGQRGPFCVCFQFYQ